MRGLCRRALLTSLFLSSFVTAGWAEEDLSDFDSLYKDTSPAQVQDGASAHVDPSVDEAALEAARRERNANLEALNRNPHATDHYADLSRQKGKWDLAPVMIGQRQDGKGTRSEDQTEVLGIELRRDF